jgi:predicted transcriptional regulator
MAGKSVSGYVDERIARRLSEVAQAEARSLANIVGQALGFYVSLPQAARSSLRRIETMATPDELRWFQAEFVRLLFKADMGLTQRQMAKEMAANIPDVGAEEEIEQAAVEWTSGVGDDPFAH